MVLRGLWDRVGSGRSLRWIATSATVGDDPEAVTEFAQRLFDAPFEWIAGEPGRQDLVAATRVSMPSGPFWGPLDHAGYRQIASSEDPAAELLRLARSHAGVVAGDAATVLAHEQHMADLRGLLAAGPRMFGELAPAV